MAVPSSERSRRVATRLMSKCSRIKKATVLMSSGLAPMRFKTVWASWAPFSSCSNVVSVLPASWSRAAHNRGFGLFRSEYSF